MCEHGVPEDSRAQPRNPAETLDFRRLWDDCDLKSQISPLAPYLFTGRRLDPETGLYYFRNRYYSPLLGKFISPDPLDYVDGMNVYAYVNGNTANLNDPMGLWSEKGVIEAFQRKHGDNPKAMEALFLVMLGRGYRLRQSMFWYDDWDVDHARKRIEINSYAWGLWRRTDENAADQLYQVLADEFYGLTDLPESWGGMGRRVGGGVAKAAGGGLSIGGGVLLGAAPDPTFLTKVGAVGAITFGANTATEGLTQVCRREGGINVIGEVAGAYGQYVGGDEGELYARRAVSVAGFAFELASVGGYSKFARTTPISRLPAETREAFKRAVARYQARFSSRGIVPGTARHKAQRWLEYQESGRKWKYPRWSKQYAVNMRNATKPLLREAQYRAALNGQNRILRTPFGRRQVDVYIAAKRRLVQLKTGKESLTTTRRGANTLAIQKDAWLVKQGWRVEWVLEKGGSAPLLEALKKANIRVHIGKLIN